MRRVWLGIGLLIVLLALGLWSSALLRTRHQPISDRLEQASQAALDGNLNQGIAMAREARDAWFSHWGGTALLADHTPMDEIDALFARLEAFAASGQAADFAAHCAQLAALVDAIVDAHSATWWNFL